MGLAHLNHFFRKSLAIGISLLVLCVAITACEPEVQYSEPPTPEITVNGETVPFEKGGFSWRFNGGEIMTDSLAPQQIAEEMEAYPVDSATEMKVSFAYAPTSIQVRSWKEEGSTLSHSSSVPISGGKRIALPEEAGVYAFNLICKWPEGKANFVVKLQIGDESKD